MNTALFEEDHSIPAGSIAVGTGIAIPNSHKNPESGLKNLSFDEWVTLIKEFPQFAPRYNWRMLRPENWQKMPFVPQQFSASLDWVRTNGANWAKILNENPDLFREKCDWSNLHGLNWAWLLRWKPEFADLCDWRKLQDSHWGWLLERHPEFEWIKFDVLQSFKHNPELPVDCNWAELTGRQWSQLLAQTPEFSDKCNWEKLSQRDFCYLLQRQPKFIDKLNFPVLYGTQWLEVIRAVPAICDIIASKLDWSCVSGQDLLEFLLGHKEYIDRIDLEKKFNGIQWSQLLSLAPEFAYKCKWKELSQNDWCYLLQQQPSFINKLEFPVLYGGRWLEFVDTSKEIGDIVVDKLDWASVDRQDMVRFLQSHSEHADKFDLSKLNCNDIVNLLSCQPQLAGNCDWGKLDADGLCALLSKRPGLADYCDWGKLTGDAWVGLLLKLPQFANKCDWSKLKGADWFHLLSEGSQFASKCDWNKLEDVANLSPFGDGWESVDDEMNEETHAWWDVLLFSHPEYAIYRKWDKVYGEACKRFPELFDSESRLIIDYSLFVKYFCDLQYYFCKWKRPIRQDWCALLDAADMVTLLARQPRLADKCNLSKLCSRDWISLISQQPQLANSCDWSRFDRHDFALLLAEQPQFAEKCETSILNGKNWAMILSRQPQLANNCEWQKLNGADWAALLAQQPSFSNKCQWELLNGHDWASLLVCQPQFANLCDWEKLYSVCPDVVNDFTPVSYEDQQMFCWTKLLQAQPQFESRCEWSRLTGKDWALLLRDMPQYADKCDWVKLYENSVIKVECDPAYCEDCSLPQESRRGYMEQPFSNWAVLLEKQPQFIPMCNWDQLGHNEKNNSHLAKLLGIPSERDLDKSSTGSNNAKRISLVSISDVDWENRYRNECFDHDVYGCVEGPLNRNRFTGEQMALWLRYNYKLARSVDWQRLDGSDWVALLRWAPYLATHCNWTKLNGNDWAILLSFYHEFADYCDWDKTKEWTGHDWALLLRHEPKLATNERLNKMNGDDLVVVLSKQPALAKVCDCNIELLDGSNWVSLLCKQPQLASACDWSKLSGPNWGDLLETQPQFADKCDWHNKTGYELVNILIKSPVRVQNYFDIENFYELTGVGEDAHSRFVEFLLASRNLENDNSVFYNLSQWHHIWDVCKKCDWNRLSEQDKLWLVRKFYKRQHLKWKELNGDEIFALLRSFPELAEKCDLNKLSVSNWVDLIDIHPKFGNLCNHMKDEIAAEKRRRLDAKKRHREDDECECIDDNDYLDDQELYYVDGVPVYGADDQEDAEIQYWNTH